MFCGAKYLYELQFVNIANNSIMEIRFSKYFLLATIVLIQSIPKGECELVCENRERKCGYRCYDPYTQSCLNGAIVCYNPLSQNCYSGGITGGLVCNNGEMACGFKCYNPNTQNCHSEKTVCAIGQRACGFKCFDSTVTCST